ncbi:replication termination factor 2-like [Sminthopsis crassicaudata]|uniref:replication termination factor 2-like n=1 Tax=Sminthopsis crassicaudata TaxID=9301 RepID=UPI003D69BC4D
MYQTTQARFEDVFPTAVPALLTVPPNAYKYKYIWKTTLLLRDSKNPDDEECCSPPNTDSAVKMQKGALFLDKVIDKENTKGDKYDDLQHAQFICLVVGLEMNGQHRFCFLGYCSCVFPKRTLNKSKVAVYNKYDILFPKDDITVLNDNKEDVDVLKSQDMLKRMNDRWLKMKLKQNLEKKSKSIHLAPQPDVKEESPGPSKVKGEKWEETNLISREKKLSSTEKSAGTNGSFSGKVTKAFGNTKRSTIDSEKFRGTQIYF